MDKLDKIFRETINLRNALFIKSLHTKLKPDEELILQFTEKLIDELIELKDELRCLKPFKIVIKL